MNDSTKSLLNKASGMILLAYVVSYIILSFRGEHLGPVAFGDKEYLNYGLSVRDTYLWQPAGMVLTGNDYNALGIVYLPLILLDRLVWHKNVIENALDTPKSGTSVPPK